MKSILGKCRVIVLLLVLTGCFFISDHSVYAAKKDKDGISEQKKVSKSDNVDEKNGWVNEDGGKRYYKDGVFLSNTMVEIDKKSYYFDTEGFLVTSGAVEVDGVLHYFDNKGVLVKNDVIEADSCFYFIDSTGTAIEKEKQMGWIEVEFDGKERKYYCTESGELEKNGVFEIESDYYGFDEHGEMYDDEGFIFYLDVVDVEDDCYYLAKPGGKLYRNTWVGRTYFFGDGHAERGLRTVDDKLYYFDYRYRYLSDQIVEVDDPNEADEYIYYQAAADGHLTILPEGLINSTPGIRYMQATYGDFAKDTWKTIDGNSYYFDDGGYAVTGVFMVDDEWYAFGADGALLKNSWVNTDKYATKDGKLATGLTKIGKKTYYFNSEGEMQTGWVKVKKSLMLFDTDGAYVGKAARNGWSKINGAKYYIKKGKVVNGVTKIGKDYYYFVNSCMQMNCVVTVSGGKQYIFNAKGKRVKSGWYSLDGKVYYISPKTHSTLKKGLHKIGEFNYYVNKDGSIRQTDFLTGSKVVRIDKTHAVTEKKQIQNGWTAVDGVYYYFKNGKKYNGWLKNKYIQNGRLCRDVIINGCYVGKTGIRQDKSGWITNSAENPWLSTARMYVKENGKLAQNEWLTIGGKKYYFGFRNSYSFYQYHTCTGVQEIEGLWYVFSDNGQLLKELGKDLEEGWITAGSDKYYIRAGEEIKNKTAKIGDKTYRFDEYGRLIKNRCEKNMYSTKDGSVVQASGWKKIDKKWFYFGKINNPVFGWIYSGAKRYYVSESGRVTGYMVIGGRLLNFNKNGLLTKIVKKQNGWVKIGKKVFYCRNGRFVRGGVYSVNGQSYLFNTQGLLVKNGAFGGYFANKKGIIVKNTWKKVNGKRVYYGMDGRNLTGVQKIGKKIYYFDSEGVEIK